MEEILRHLPARVYVLDVGSRQGSFDARARAFLTIRVDLEQPLTARAGGYFVRADAALLPFRECSFAAIICNHSLEHFERLDESLQELRRVGASDAALYVAVPDATTLTDQIYRWLGRGGGHVNSFSSPTDLAQRVERLTGLQQRACRLLFTSLSFLNAKNWVAAAPRKAWLLGGGQENVLRLANWCLRLSDRLLRTRWAVYGWALYFGTIREPIPSEPWVNVCLRCGSAHASEWLLTSGTVRGWYGLVRVYRCPSCGTANVFHLDESFSASH